MSPAPRGRVRYTLGMDHLSEAVRQALTQDMTIDITTTGRRSQAPRRIEIWFLYVDDRFWIAGTPGPRDWLANLMVQPRFVFHLKESIVADLDAMAALVHDRAVRRRLFESDAASWYRGQCDLESLIETAPLVEVTFPKPIVRL